MTSYVRPAVTEETYRDADGRLIEYGSRWGREGPPADSYGVASHPERFAPLHHIAAALIDYLQHNYDVEAVDDLSYAQDVRHAVDAVRAVRLTPAAEDAAPLTFVVTRYPGVIVHAGLLHDLVYPVCGCDACDESLVSMADELEWNVLAVVSGGYREEVRGSVHDAWLAYELTAADGSRHSGGGGRAAPDARAHLQAAATRLDGLPGGWAPWTRR